MKPVSEAVAWLERELDCMCAPADEHDAELLPIHRHGYGVIGHPTAGFYMRRYAPGVDGGTTAVMRPMFELIDDVERHSSEDFVCLICRGSEIIAIEEGDGRD